MKQRKAKSDSMESIPRWVQGAAVMFLLSEKSTLKSENMVGFYSSAQQLDTLCIHWDIPAGERSLERQGWGVLMPLFTAHTAWCHFSERPLKAAQSFDSLLLSFLWLLSLSSATPVSLLEASPARFHTWLLEVVNINRNTFVFLIALYFLLVTPWDSSSLYELSQRKWSLDFPHFHAQCLHPEFLQMQGDNSSGQRPG